jgi:hypothetical protein
MIPAVWAPCPANAADIFDVEESSAYPTAEERVAVRVGWSSMSTEPPASRSLPSFPAVYLAAVAVSLLICGCGNGDDEKVYRYPGGQVKLREEYSGGQLLRSTWFLPTGEELRVTKWIDGTGTSYTLDDEGRITSEAPFWKGGSMGWAIDFEYTDEGVKARFVYEVSETRPANGFGVYPEGPPTSAPRERP